MYRDDKCIGMGVKQSKTSAAKRLRTSDSGGVLEGVWWVLTKMAILMI